MAPKIAIIYVSAALYANGAKAQVKTALERTDHWGIHMYGHIAKMAEAEKAGIEAAGGTADLYQ